MRWLWLITMLLSLFSCVDEPKPSTVDNSVPPVAKGVFVLNEGLFNANNSNLSYYSLDSAKVWNDIFASVNGRKIGDTGNDLLLSGNKLFILVNVSSTLEVVDARTFKSIKHLSLQHNGKPVSPRKMALMNGRLLIASFDGSLSVLDTSNYNIIQRLALGRNPDAIATNNSIAVVSNSGGLSFPNYDSTVSVITNSSSTFAEQKKVKVGANPGAIQLSNSNKAFVIVRGNSVTDMPVLKYFNTGDGTLVTTSIQEPFALAKREINNSELLYVAHRRGGSYRISCLDMNTISIVDSIGFDFQLTRPYGLEVSDDGKVIIGDAIDYTSKGRVNVFNSKGVVLHSFQAGINPGHFAIIQ